MKQSIAIALAAVVIILGLSVTYNMGKSYERIFIKDYYLKTEALLDSINSWDSSFKDTIMETDVYYEYEQARSAIY